MKIWKKREEKKGIKVQRIKSVLTAPFLEELENENAKRKHYNSEAVRWGPTPSFLFERERGICGQAVKPINFFVLFILIQIH